jgi:hypothetical protein
MIRRRELQMAQRSMKRTSRKQKKSDERSTEQMLWSESTIVAVSALR